MGDPKYPSFPKSIGNPFCRLHTRFAASRSTKTINFADSASGSNDISVKDAHSIEAIVEIVLVELPNDMTVSNIRGSFRFLGSRERLGIVFE